MKRSATNIIQRVGAHVGFIAVLLALLLCATGRGLADDASEAKKLIDQAEATLKNFMNDPDIQGFVSSWRAQKASTSCRDSRRVPSSLASKAATVSCLRVMKKPGHGANRYFMKPRRPVLVSRQEPSHKKPSC